jgi:hypothetical protein
MATHPVSYAYLKDWIAFPDPRPIILECIPSRTGMSLQVYDREKRIFAIGGCGFDRIGCAIAQILENLWQNELRAFFSDPDIKIEINGRFAHFPDFYGVCRGEGDIYLQGMSGEQSMKSIGSAIGLRIRTYDSKSGTLIHITKA